MITQEAIDRSINGVKALTGQDEPKAVYLVMDFDPLVATVGTVGEDKSLGVNACKVLLSSMENSDLLVVRNEIEGLLAETRKREPEDRV